MNVLVTGVTGFIGARLTPALQRRGHVVRGLSRHPEHVELAVPVARADAVSGVGLEPALEGIDVAYYLIHAMEPAASGDRRFDVRERVAAENFALAAQRAGVQRIVYLGGLAPAGAVASAHLSSRLAVERILLAAVPGSVAFRAAIVVGARSRSFRFLVRLVERLPVLAVPAWRGSRTRPIDERDVIELLVRTATAENVCGQSLDLGGPDVVSYGELIELIRDHMLVSRPMIGLGRLTMTPIASRIAAVIAGEQHALISPLMEGLDGDLLPRDDRAVTLLGVRLHSLDAAIEHALGEWEMAEPLAAR
jgi:uncharacterized protein YbjT (DUF2867 family)